MGGGWDFYMPVMGMLLIQFIYAGMNLSTRVALLQGMSPMVFVVYRQALATIFIAPLAYYFSGGNSGSYSLNLRSFSLIFLMSLIGITVNQNCYFEGLYLASSSVATAMTNIIPALTFVIAAFAGMETVDIRSMRTLAKIVGTVLCVSGTMSIALLKGPKLLNVENPSSKSIIGSAASTGENWLLGCLFLLGSSCTWAIWLILQVPASTIHPHYLSLSAWMCLMSALQSAVVTLFLEPDPNSWKFNSLLEFGCCLYAGILGSAITFCLQAWCISRRGPLFSAMFSPLCTLIVTVFAALVLHEEIYMGSLIGAIGVIIGLYSVLWGKAEVVEVKEKANPKSVVNLTEEVNILINDESSKEAYCKADLEEPLLPPKSPLHY